MDKHDSIELLRETNAGIQMGVSSIDDILDDVRNDELKNAMLTAKAEHDRLGGEAHRLLHTYGCGTKEPHPVAKVMSSAKTAVKMAADGFAGHTSDRTAAELLTDGCSMGIKSLNHYLNQYRNADSSIKSLTKQVIRSEEQLLRDIRGFL